jgi:hypothetical protein
MKREAIPKWFTMLISEQASWRRILSSICFIYSIIICECEYCESDCECSMCNNINPMAVLKSQKLSHGGMGLLIYKYRLMSRVGGQQTLALAQTIRRHARLTDDGGTSLARRLQLRQEGFHHLSQFCRCGRTHRRLRACYRATHAHPGKCNILVRQQCSFL